MEVFVARQPIFDRNRKVWAYELLFRSAAMQTGFDGTEAGSATRQVISNSMLSIGFDKLLRGKHACINFGRDMLLGDWYTTPIAPDDTKLEEMKYNETQQKILAELPRLFFPNEEVHNMHRYPSIIQLNSEQITSMYILRSELQIDLLTHVALVLETTGFAVQLPCEERMHNDL